MQTNRREIGKKGEELATQFLIRKGYTILEQNYRSPLGEIDLIALDGLTIVFTEVKTRRSASFGPPALSVTKQKQKKLVKLAQMYILQKNLRAIACRFDVISIVARPDGSLEDLDHIENAFQVEGGEYI
ncbi:MAG: YraN family protein [Candidatus Tectomicrobia bacterium]|nr:YraN family protein [Candidatus Tectomicrobia bacterium]